MSHNNNNITGTNCFVSNSAASKFYKEYNPGMKAAEINELVREKIKAGEIEIGAPKIKPGQKLYTDDIGRYHIQGA